MTQLIWDLLKESDILLVQVPANMTRIFQPLNHTINISAKSFFRERFAEWYSNEIKLQLEARTKLDLFIYSFIYLFIYLFIYSLLKVDLHITLQ